MQRFDYVAFIEIINGNPNGDPDRDNKPRIDPYSGLGMLSDVCIKRHVRNFMQNALDLEIFVKEGSVLSQTKEDALKAKQIEPKAQKDLNMQRALLERYVDLRCFGGILSMGKEVDKRSYNAGEATGPIVVPIANSVDPIQILNLSLTRCCLQNYDDTARGKKILNGLSEEDKADFDGSVATSGQMGNKHFIPYAVYRIDGTINGCRADKFLLTQEDVKHFFTAMEFCFEFDSSASRQNMSTRELIVWEHESPYGNARRCDVMDTVEIKRNSTGPARCWSDYTVTCSNPPNSSVKMIRRLSK